MKICFLMVSHSSSVIGGAEVQVNYILEYLNKTTSHQLFYICRKAQTEKYQGIEILKTRSNKYLRRYFKSIDFFSINKYLKKIKPDIVYTRTGTAYVGIAALYCKRRNAKLVFHIAHKEDVTPIKVTDFKGVPKWLERWIYLYGLRNADAIIGQANYQNQLLEKYYNRSCNAIIPNFHPSPKTIEKEETPIKVVWVANLKESKQPQLFIQLANEFQNNSCVKFIMIGALQSPKYRNIKTVTQHLLNFEYLGPLPLVVVNEILDHAHIFINTSLGGEEGFPNTFIQAWMREVPVISLNIDPDNIIKNNDLGYHSLTYTRLIKDLKNLIKDRNLRRDKGIRAKSFANRHYGLANIKSILNLMETS